MSRDWQPVRWYKTEAEHKNKYLCVYVYARTFVHVYGAAPVDFQLVVLGDALRHQLEASDPKEPGKKSIPYLISLMAFFKTTNLIPSSWNGLPE